MLERRVIFEGQKPTQEQIERIRALKNRPIVFDDEFPEPTEEELKKFRRVNPNLKREAG